MSKSYSVAEARAKLPDILDEVASGREVQLTRRGRPVAVVISPQQYEGLRGERRTFADAYRVFLDRHPLHEIGLEKTLFPPLRSKASGRRVRL